MKAGLTGWAQTNGWRGNTAVEARIEYDLYYIKQWSLRLDLQIMWLTLASAPTARAFLAHCIDESYDALGETLVRLAASRAPA